MVGITARASVVATNYGGDKGIFAYGYIGGGTYVTYKNLVSSSGVVASNATGAGTGRSRPKGCGYSFSA